MKMNTIIRSSLALLLSSMAYTAISQNQILEKDYEISRKAKKGYLGNVEKKENGKFDMIYILPSSARKIKTETYHYDKDANQLGVDRDEMEIERARTKWKWFAYHGDHFLTNSLTASINITGQLVFRKKLVTANWNWWTGRYERNVKMTDKVKPKNESGHSYRFLGGAYEVERDSSVLVLALAASDNSKLGDPTKYDLLKCDNEVNIAVAGHLDFPYAVQPVFSQPVADDLSGDLDNDDAPRDWVVIMAPTKANSSKDNRADDPSGFYYLRISPEGKVKENFAFKAPAPGLRILQAYEKNGAVLLYGMSTGKEGKFIDQALGTVLVPTTSADADEQAAGNTDEKKAFGLSKMVNTMSGKEDVGVSQEKLDDLLDEKKYTHFAFARIEGGKMAWGSLTEMDEVNDKAVATEGMKHPLKFDGNKFSVNNLQFLKDGSMLLSIQDFKKIKSKKNTASDKIYKGMYLMHFNNIGQLLHNYTVNIDQRSKRGFFNKSPLTADMYPATSFVYQLESGQLKWVMHIVKAIDKNSSESSNYFAGSTTTTTTYTPLYSIEYGNIDLKNGSASEFKTLGEDEDRKYYLYENYNTLRSDNLIYFFSETLKGDKMLISRMDL
jgi:hypothetical protein